MLYITLMSPRDIKIVKRIILIKDTLNKVDIKLSTFLDAKDESTLVSAEKKPASNEKRTHTYITFISMSYFILFITFIIFSFYFRIYTSTIILSI